MGIAPARSHTTRFSASPAASRVLPNNFRQNLLDRFDRFARGGMTTEESTAISAAAQALRTHTTTAQDQGWTTMFDGTLKSLNEVAEDFDDLAEGGRAGGGTGAQRTSPNSRHGEVIGAFWACDASNFGR
ncbi:MAG: hypothetical protein IT581_20310 [Verrucomicrobiales bacterium]|nr:hypothetical protein [Verrucomicrobiales bacterium]